MRRAAVATIALALGVGCGPFRVALPIRGVVLDAASGAPVAGALIDLSVPAGNRAERAWAQADADGRFSLDGGASLVRPSWNGRENQLNVLAPGYALSSVRVRDAIGPGIPWPGPFLSPARIALEPLRYRLERSASVHFARWLENDAAHAAYVRAATHLGTGTPASVPPGVFVRQPGAAFDRVGAVRLPDGRPRVLARDAASGRLYGWTADGAAVAVERATTWAAFGGWDGSLTRVDGAWDSALRGRPEVHCVARRPGDVWLAAADLDEPITACAIDGAVAYVALKRGGIRRLVRSGEGFEEDGRFASASAAVGGKRPFLALWADTLYGLGTVYAVAGSDLVYRFADDGTPDQRVEPD